jgi:putative membrane protein
MSPAFPSWQPHPEVWMLVTGLAAGYVYAITVLGPRVVRRGPVVTRAQIGWFVVGMVIMWMASDWPVHDVAEERLYFVHMSQHILLSLVMPAALLMATPTWLARLVIGDGRAYRVLRRLTHPIVATVLFNATVVVTHWPAVVNHSVESWPLHYGLHVLLVSSALLMWMPVCGPLPEIRLTLPAQMLYLFVQSIVPTVPAAWLTFADGVVYKAYDHLPRLWGISVTADQQAAGMLMKVVGGFYLWTIITVLFFRFASREGWGRGDRAPVPARGVSPELAEPDPAPLTWDEVQRELERLGPAPPG